MKQASTTSKNRIPYLDTLRVIACFMVILVHSPIPHKGLSESMSYGIISYLCSPCIGLFLMVTGALLLPLSLDIKPFISRRFTRILWPLITWSLIYILIDAIDRDRTFPEVISNIFNIPFGPTTKFVQSWYLYTLLGIYLFIPVFNAWIKNNDKRNSIYFIAIWCMTLCTPYIKALSIGAYPTLSIFAGYFGYIALGYYLHKYPVKMTLLRNNLTLAILLILFAGIIPAIIYMADIPGYDIYNNIIYNYRSLSTMAMCVFIFSLIQNFNPKNIVFQKIMAHLSPLTFGIFLIHYAVIYYIIRPYFMVNPLNNLQLEIAAVTLGAFASSYLITLIVNKLPFKKYLIG